MGHKSSGDCGIHFECYFSFDHTPSAFPIIPIQVS
jgi:hypothetical protein